MSHILIITGQTATGKTKLALQKAKELDGELISCDSRQAYSGLDIVTGKDITPGSRFHPVSQIGEYRLGFYELQGVPLWLYDVANPHQEYSSYDFQSCATSVILDILKRGKIPIIVGGSFFYLRHLLYEIPSQHIGADWKLRETLNTQTVSELQEKLQTLNPDLYQELNNSDRNNPQRLIRKIELTMHGLSLENYTRMNPECTLQKKLNLPDLSINIKTCSHATPEEARSAITDRVEKRIRAGAVQEVQDLLAKGYTAEDPGLKTIGCKEITAFLRGEWDEKTMVQKWIQAEVSYAKRQLTFMNKYFPSIG
ncbi:hypothetical protein HGA88_01410 [Candidatus Roizmanbacteria bacterium]|nr:hypothetical protein [Candidatus Roizmanbacteria bacterium]